MAPCSTGNIVLGKFLAVYLVTLATLAANCLSIALTTAVGLRFLPAGAISRLPVLGVGAAVTVVAFVGLAAPHLGRRFAPAPQGFTLLASAAAGGVLLLAADVLARGLVAPGELPLGVLTAVLGGSYLLWLLHRRRL
jgi:iron complex transport system permease protein